MLEQILDYIHNYFVKEVTKGTFTISSGSVEVSLLQENQYFKIVGSVFNDGIHRYPANDLIDETFTGEIWALAIPQAVITLSSDIEQYVAKYGEVLDSPYQSESYGGYSYTKKSGSGSQSGGGGGAAWADAFRSRLNHWRKIS